jgi:hypothetical protein
MTGQYEKDLAELKSKGTPMLKDLAELIRRRTELAKEYIPKLYEDLRKEHFDGQDARAKIEEDCKGLWSKATIRKYLPDEAKNKKAQDMARKANATKSEKLTKARMDLAENGSVCQKGQESREKIMAMTIDTSGRSSAYASEAGGDDRSQPAEGSPFASDRKEIKALRMKVQEKDDRIKELERQVHELREALTKSTFKAADGLRKESARLNERPSEQEKLSLEPYECKAELEVKGRPIPLHVYCIPAERTVRVEIDTKRLGTGRYA